MFKNEDDGNLRFKKPSIFQPVNSVRFQISFFNMCSCTTQMELILIKNLLNSGERNNPKLQKHSPRENPTCMYFVLHYRVESTLQRVKMDEGPIYQAEGYHWNHPFNSIARLLTGHKTCYYMSYYLVVERMKRKRKLDHNSWRRSSPYIPLLFSSSEIFNSAGRIYT